MVDALGRFATAEARVLMPALTGILTFSTLDDRRPPLLKQLQENWGFGFDL